MEAFRQYDAGQLSTEKLNAVADRAVLEALHIQVDAGVDIVTDGEQRRSNFFSFIAEKLDGVEIMTLAQLMDVVEDRASFERTLRTMDAPAFAIKNPTVVGPVKLRMP